VFQALKTISPLKQSAIPRSYIYKPPKSGGDVSSICPIDTALQMVFFLWFRGSVPRSVVKKDSLLPQTMIHIRDQNYDQAQHEFQVKKYDQRKSIWMETETFGIVREIPGIIVYSLFYLIQMVQFI
jgi:hypothetical protein